MSRNPAIPALMLLLSVFCSSAAAQNRPVSAPMPARPADVRIGGELGRRLTASFDRLEQEDYRAPRLFDQPNEGWPGDKEGRTIFGLIQLAQITGRESTSLPQLIAEYARRVNPRGYLGPIADPERISEQVLGGQFWVVRAFLDYADWQQNERVLPWAERLVDDVYLSAASGFRSYPIDPAARRSAELVFGREVGSSGNWVLSSDVGCGLAGSLDALTAAYARQPSPRLEAVIEEVIERFMVMDLLGVSAQLHSTLISTRSLLRHYETTGRPALLGAAVERYRLYRERAMTDNFENHNWFGRPEWTEGCAVVDSFIVAVQLWRFTGRAEYLEDAHHIYYNGLCVNQRANGGLGCNSCPSLGDPWLTVKTQEAWWCCTQRGADGLARAAQFSFFTDSEGAILPFYHEGRGTLSWGEQAITISETTGYPHQGRVRLEITDSSLTEPRAIRLFLPSWAENPVLTVNGRQTVLHGQNQFIAVKARWQVNDVVMLSFDQQVQALPPLNRANGADQGEYHTFHCGPLILGYAGGNPVEIDRNARIMKRKEREFAVEGREIVLQPIYHLLDPAVSQDAGYKRQILFTREASE